MALFEKLIERAEQRAAAIASNALEAAKAAATELPGINVKHMPNQLAISGRGLMRRWLDDARLRFALRGIR